MPYGYKKNLAIPSLPDFKTISQILQSVTLVAKDYREVVKTAKAGDLVYLDPPYPPINGSSFFTHYTKERFSQTDQKSVAQVAKDLSERGCFVVVTNADTRAIRKLYVGWRITRAKRTRWVTSAKHKHNVSELIITNFGVREDL